MRRCGSDVSLARDRTVQAGAAAMIDRLVHHAEVVSLKGNSYRLKDRDLGRVPAAGTTDGGYLSRPVRTRRQARTTAGPAGPQSR